MKTIDLMVRVNPECNLDTIKDGRGAIFSYVPMAPIVEWTHQFIKAGKIRGNHCHPEFDEYILLVSGNGVEVAQNTDGTETRIDMSKGICIFIPSGTIHVFLAITDCESVSFLTKKWNDCKHPIVHANMGYGAGDHGDPTSSYYKK
jgi:oxalate decarboxylase/phosphoglucose isomerase-like protein (cupin superfamily)